MNSRTKIIAGVSALVVLLGVIVGLSLAALNKPETAPKKITKAPIKKKPKPKPQVANCPLDGRPIEVQASRPVALMVENFSTIRPQAGTGSACVVVEGLAEGGITRFMLVYGNHGADNIGPVRSARTHFVALAKGWDALYGHVGGSVDFALKAIRDWGVADWDQMGHGSSYTRVGWTRAPHNVFTSTARLREDASQYRDGDMASRGFTFKKAPAPEALPDGTKTVTIDFSTSEYKVEYRYDRQSNTYKRFNGGQPHVDAGTKMQLAPSNIVILRAPTSPIPGAGGLLDVNMMGSGSLTVVQDGRVIDGTWEKPLPSSPLALRDGQGREIPLTPGQIWVEIVAPTTPVDVTR